MPSVQDNLIILPGSRKRGDISRVSILRWYTVNYRRRVCQSYSEPREERAACSSGSSSGGGLGQKAGNLGRHRGTTTPGWYPARCCGRATAFEMMGRDWVAVTRVQLFVQPGVPPLLFVSEGRWGPQKHFASRVGDKTGRLGGREGKSAPRPHARPHRSSVQCTLPSASAGGFHVH